MLNEKWNDGFLDVVSRGTKAPCYQFIFNLNLRLWPFYYMMLYYDVIWCYMGKKNFLQADLTVSWWKKGTFFLHGEIWSIFTSERIETGFMQLRFWTSRPTEQKVWKCSQLYFWSTFFRAHFFKFGWNRRLYPLFQFFPDWKSSYHSKSKKLNGFMELW